MKPSAFYIKCLEWVEAEVPVCEIRRTVFAEQSGTSQKPISDERDLTAQHFLLYLAADQTPVAHARLLDNEHLDKIMVYAEYRGQKLGTALMNYVHDIAKQQGIISTSLRAGLDSTGFFRKFGYINDGEPDIDYQLMRLVLPSDQSAIDFNPVQGEQLTVVKAPSPPDYQPRPPRPANKPIQTTAILGESTAISRLLDIDDIIDHTAALISQASEQVFIYSPTLAPEIYCAPKVLEAISSMARRNPVSQVRVLVDDTAPLVKRHHSLLKLQHRINSLISLKCTTKSYPVDSLGMVLADDKGWLEIIDHNPLTLSGNFNDPAKVKQWHHIVKLPWDHATVPTDIRQFTL